MPVLDFCQLGLHIVAIGENQFGSQQVKQEMVAIGWAGRLTKEYQDAVHPAFGSCSDRLAAVIGLHGASGDQGVCALV